MTLVLKKVPNFTANAVINGSIKPVTLHDIPGYKILLFYPLDFTFVCPSEIMGFSDNKHLFDQLNTTVLAISVDSEYSHLAWSKQPRREGGIEGVQIPLVSDLTHEISKAYDVYMEDAGHSMRGLFLIDENNVCKTMSVNEPPIGRSVSEALRLMEALQFTEANGEVCPLNWSKGDKAIIPTPEGSMEFFATK